MTTRTDPSAQYYTPISNCRCGCGKPSNVILYSHRNDSLGYWRVNCAERAIKEAHKLGDRMPDWVVERRG
jgi:hypothetical protein